MLDTLRREWVYLWYYLTVQMEQICLLYTSDPQMLEGRFIGHEGIPETVTVTCKGGALAATVGKYETTLTYCGGTRFLAKDAAGPGHQRARLEFFIRDGRSWAVRNGSRIFTREDG